MTEELAKQKVRETHPAAFRSAKGTVWSEHGMTKVRLGKNLKNAAESLPAQPEQEICRHCQSPIKPIYPMNPGEGYVHIGYGDICDFQYCINGGTFAEPKPTPSTDIGCEGCGEPVYLTRGYGYSHVDTTLNVSCDARPKPNHPSVPKPKPDSSSIPDQKPWLDQAVDLLNLYHSGYCPKDVAKNFLEKCKENFGNVAEYKPFVDSSSVPDGKTFEKWWNKIGNDQFGQSVYEDIAQGIWNAAKGQSNGR